MPVDSSILRLRRSALRAAAVAALSAMRTCVDARRLLAKNSDTVFSMSAPLRVAAVPATAAPLAAVVVVVEAGGTVVDACFTIALVRPCCCCGCDEALGAIVALLPPPPPTVVDVVLLLLFVAAFVIVAAFRLLLISWLARARAVASNASVSDRVSRADTPSCSYAP